MTIHSIKVENIKGIKNKLIEFQVTANKPSIFVAPNGFGKSSISAAFNSLTSTRLKLDSSLYHKSDETLKPKLTLQVEIGGVIQALSADENSNTISSALDVFVINSRLGVKATKRNMGGFTSVSAALVIDEVVLIDKIPAKVKFEYSAAAERLKFGANGKILPNIDSLLSNQQLSNVFIDNFDLMGKVSGARVQAKLKPMFDGANIRQGTSDQIKNWLFGQYEADLESLECLKVIADLIQEDNSVALNRVDALLAAYQICTLYSADKTLFKAACLYLSYVEERESFIEVISAFDTTWKNIKPKEVKGKLVVGFPEAMHISNGQRDCLCFAACMQRIKRKIGKKSCVLIVDEVFDYLDDANLTAVQYYITKLIDEFKSCGRKIYPIIFTHLNPIYFKNYAFSNQKVYFLDEQAPVVNEHFKRLIVNRESAAIKAGVERNLLHYDPVFVDLSQDFNLLGLKQTWGKSDIFYAHLNAEWQKYISNQTDYDPFAICCYARVQIEKNIYDRILNDADKKSFLDEHGTKKKLKFAEQIGVTVPEVCYLLGIIYNDGMHYRNGVDNITPIASKLGNMVIRKMLREATNS